ncbi:hypothetical protein CRG98_030707 [Punica granatum]|uniref:Uncharacterized protein n=1 Tax=Punica granatum TaxID=22663 RepID=A0A2I0IXW5_PUNGR|nr:hypothetical protein CRG98_030707 [Punica granatum]
MAKPCGEICPLRRLKAHPREPPINVLDALSPLASLGFGLPRLMSFNPGVGALFLVHAELWSKKPFIHPTPRMGLASLWHTQTWARESN